MQIYDFLSITKCQEDAEFLYNSKEQLFAGQMKKQLVILKSKAKKNFSDLEIDTSLMEWICKMYDEHNKDYENIEITKFKNISINEFKEMPIYHLSQLLGSWEDAKFLHSCKNTLFDLNFYNNQQAMCKYT